MALRKVFGNVEAQQSAYGCIIFFRLYLTFRTGEGI